MTWGPHDNKRRGSSVNEAAVGLAGKASHYPGQLVLSTRLAVGSLRCEVHWCSLDGSPLESVMSGEVMLTHRPRNEANWGYQ